MLVSERIEPKSLEIFGNLIPEALKEEIRSEELFAVASFDTADADEPLVGVTVMGTADLWAQIVWYALTPSYDTPRYLGRMIRERVTDALAAGEAEGVYAALPTYERTKADARAFAAEGFEIVDSKSNVLSFALESLKTDKLPEMKDPKEFISLGKADDRTLRMLANHMAHDARNVPVEIPVRWEQYDKDLSIIRMEEENPIGVALVRIKDGTAYISLVYEKEPRDFLRMISVLIRRGTEKLDKSTQVIVPIVDERIFEVMKAIAPDAERASQTKAYLRFER